jgi:hypothetical protein
MGAFLTETLGRPTKADIEERDRQVAAIREWWHEVLAKPPQFASEAIAEVARLFAPRSPETGQAEPPAEVDAARHRRNL